MLTQVHASCQWLHGHGSNAVLVLGEHQKLHVQHLACVTSTDRCQSHCHAGELITKANGFVGDPVVRPCDSGIKGFVDPDVRMIGLHMYDGLIKVCPPCLQP